MKRFFFLISVTLLTFASSFSDSISQNLHVHFLDVGQADCALVQTPSGKSLLIDAGNIEDAGKIISYLENQYITRLDVVVGTHPHADHVGGMAQVIRKLDIGDIYMPYATNNTVTFPDLLMAIKDKGLKVSTAKAGVRIDLDPALEIMFLAPNSDTYGDPNNYIAVLKITHKRSSFLLTGDAGIVSEEEMLRSRVDFKADVLKVAHHGSSSSSSDGFLENVSSKYAVISVGSGNNYGHPAKDTLDRLARYNVEVFRTDVDGTIIISSDGEKIRVEKQASSLKPKAPPSAPYLSDKPSNSIQADKDIVTVYITRTGKKYHRFGCQYLSRSCIPIELKRAKDVGYAPCKACKPAQ